MQAPYTLWQWPLLAQWHFLLQFFPKNPFGHPARYGKGENISSHSEISTAFVYKTQILSFHPYLRSCRQLMNWGKDSHCPLGSWPMASVHVSADDHIHTQTALHVSLVRHKLGRRTRYDALGGAGVRWWWADVLNIRCINVWNFKK